MVRSCAPPRVPSRPPARHERGNTSPGASVDYRHSPGEKTQQEGFKITKKREIAFPRQLVHRKTASVESSSCGSGAHQRPPAPSSQRGGLQQAGVLASPRRGQPEPQLPPSGTRGARCRARLEPVPENPPAEGPLPPPSAVPPRRDSVSLRILKTRADGWGSSGVAGRRSHQLPLADPSSSARVAGGAPLFGIALSAAALPLLVPQTPQPICSPLPLPPGGALEALRRAVTRQHVL